jgi:alpha-L-rhamnosidase
MHHLLLLACLTGLTATSDSSNLVSQQLRCEYLVNPLGIDVVLPRLSWVLQSKERGQRQTAYRVLVASSPENLARDEGDLWDSGKIESDATIQIAYAGKPLASRTACHWKVQVWDKDGKPSGWSKPASWTMGLLKSSDWKGQWIASPEAASRKPATPHNGYHSQFVDRADAAKWVVIDLGKVQPIDAIRLYPAHPFDWQPDTPGFLFPVRFKVEAAQAADFSDAKTVVDQTAADVTNPQTNAPVYRFAPVAARFVRLTATRLGRRSDGKFGLALAEIEALANGKNLAKDAKTSASDATETDSWSVRFLCDGRTEASRGNSLSPAPVTTLRKEFAVKSPIRRATVYVTARGLYELRINGRRVGDHLLAPEWTEYDRRLQYQTYDVTSLVRSGTNVMGAMLGDGWYAGRIGLAPGRYNYGTFTQFLAQLEIETADGQRHVIPTDASWRSTQNGPIRLADILDGEIYDARQEMPGWDAPGFSADGWKPVHASPFDVAKLVAQRNEPIRVVEELKPVKITEPKPGTFIFDFGQNMVGWCRVNLRGTPGAKIQFRHGEVVNDDGTLYTANLRGAPQIDQYILRDAAGVYEPRFTYHGFRYLEMTGATGKRPTVDDAVGRVFFSSAPAVGRFVCSNAMVNQLMRNIDWTQRANMESTPTDCPQRDERLGWMGDIQAFSQTAIFNRDMAGFFSKWVPDVRDAQLPDGRYPNFAPRAFGRDQAGGMGVPAWADAGTVVPWRVYVNYGDRRMLEEHFQSAKRWVDYVAKKNPAGLWLNDRSDDYNDWLNGDTLILAGYPKTGSAVPNEVHATAFFAHSTEIVAKMADVLGRKDDAQKYAARFVAIRDAFNKAFVAPDGKIRGDTQAGYALALHFNLLPESLRPKAVAHMMAAIQRYKAHPSTGIQSTHRMMIELSRNGQHEEACRLINLRTIPSWGYMIDMGGTTIWERWDGYVKGRGFQDPGMNSFNHWAFGSVGEWVWREIAGLNPDEQRPGYKHFTVRPRVGKSFTWANADYESIRGAIACRWKLDGRKFSLELTVPPNTSATVYVPTDDAAAVREGGIPASQAQGVRPAVARGGEAAFEVDSGTYVFTADCAPGNAGNARD